MSGSASRSVTLVTFTQNRLRATNSYSQGRGIDDEKMRKIIA
jgi:hypothetical protein